MKTPPSNGAGEGGGHTSRVLKIYHFDVKISFGVGVGGNEALTTSYLGKRGWHPGASIWAGGTGHKIRYDSLREFFFSFRFASP